MKLDTIKEKLREIFITKETLDLRLNPIEKIVYTAMSVMGIAVLTALIATVIVKVKP